MGGVAWERVEKAFSKELVVPKLTPHFADSNKILKTAVWKESVTTLTWVSESRQLPIDVRVWFAIRVAPGWTLEGVAVRRGRRARISHQRAPSRGGPSTQLASLAPLTALVSVFGGAALTDFGIVDALMVMRSNFDIGSIVTIRRLVEVRKNYFIPSKYELHAPLPGEHPYDAFPNGFSLSIDALKT
ncbi:hypothetical protein B296_00015727 [Ensete ventricosum]|uniref:Uncharacterized protein n=1 Tax=Ensete ventricosum TaxID=4639 RepID=A0A426ZTU1_ENSVE|nr:hypothetical protein B296_00015727 [Ensete ventricosum]